VLDSFTNYKAIINSGGDPEQIGRGAFRIFETMAEFAKPSAKGLKPPAIPEQALSAGPLSPKQRQVLEALPSKGSRTEVARGDFSLNDLAKLTQETGREFAVLTKGDRRLVIGGDAASVPLGPDEMKKLSAEGWKLTAHSHPSGLTPSVGDGNVVAAGGQKRSIIVDSENGRISFTPEQGAGGATDSLSAGMSRQQAQQLVDGLTPKEKEFLGRVANGENGIDIISDRTQLRDTVNSINRKLGQPDLRASADVARRSERFEQPDLDDAAVDRYAQYDRNERLASLSPQERQVVDAIQANPYISNEQLASQLGVPPSTLQTRLTSIYDKLELNTAQGNARRQLVDIAASEGQFTRALYDGLSPQAQARLTPRSEQQLQSLDAKLRQLSETEMRALKVVMEEPYINGADLARRVGVQDFNMGRVYDRLGIPSTGGVSSRQQLLEVLGVQPGLSPKAQRLLEQAPPQQRAQFEQVAGTLTDRELDVVEQLRANPYSTREELGQRLGITGLHLDHLYQKLGISTQQPPAAVRDELLQKLGIPQAANVDQLFSGASPAVRDAVQRMDPARREELGRTLGTLSPREQQVAALLVQNPGISAMEMAEAMGTGQRSAYSAVQRLAEKLGIQAKPGSPLMDQVAERLVPPEVRGTQVRELADRLSPRAREVLGGMDPAQDPALVRSLSKLNERDLGIVQQLRRDPNLSAPQLAQRLGIPESEINIGRIAYDKLGIEPQPGVSPRQALTDRFASAGAGNDAAQVLRTARVDELFAGSSPAVRERVRQLDPARKQELGDILGTLTPREKNVVTALAQNPELTTAQLAETLGMSRDNVHATMQRVYDKFGVQPRPGSSSVDELVSRLVPPEVRHQQLQELAGQLSPVARQVLSGVDLAKDPGLVRAVSKLSERELSIVRLVQQEPQLSLPQMAQRLGIPESEINISRLVYDKLGIPQQPGGSPRQALRERLAPSVSPQAWDIIHRAPASAQAGLQQALGRLEPKDLRVVDLIQRNPGISNAEIASQLGLSPSTVPSTMSRIYSKLELPASNREALLGLLGQSKPLSQVAQGILSRTPAQARAGLEQSLARLDPRELQMVELIQRNPLISNQEIASRLGISESTVGSAISNVYSKLELPASREALLGKLGQTMPRNPVAQGILDRAPAQVRDQVDAGLAKLSPREQQIVEVIQRNPRISNAEIGSQLGMSSSAVGATTSSIYTKLGLEGANRSELLGWMGQALPMSPVAQGILDRVPASARGGLAEALEQLQPRELEVLDLIQRNPSMSNQEIASRLGTTDRAVAIANSNIYSKLGVTEGSRNGLLERLGLASPQPFQGILDRAPAAAKPELQRVLPQLTSRDLQVLELIQLNPRISNVEMASRLDTSSNAVGISVSRIYKAFELEQASRQNLLEKLGIRQ
jgi:DNA-binding CsgD family transcriptional regulator